MCAYFSPWDLMDNGNLLQWRMLLLRDYIRDYDIIPNVCIYPASEQAVWRRGTFHGMVYAHWLHRKAYLPSDLEILGGVCFYLLSMIM